VSEPEAPPRDAADRRRRATDRGALCMAALRASQFWDWVDKRAIDKHIVSLAILYGTVEITRWAMHYAEASARPGIETAAIIAAVLVPYNALQGAAIGFYFNARKGTDGNAGT